MIFEPGFTLIELIIVVILLGILAVIAVPQYVNLTTDAQNATTSALAATLSSANSINYGARNLNSTNGVAVSNCVNMSQTLQQPLPPGYSIQSAAVAVNTTILCTLTGPNSTSAVFAATGIN